MTYQPEPNEMTIRDIFTLANAIKRFRKLANVSQVEVSEQAGVQQHTISRVEAGNERVRLNSLFSILAALDLELVIRRRKVS